MLENRKRLAQVVANVLSNASKYTPEGGNINARLDVLEDGIVLRITDDGIGMAPEVVSRVFELFAQAERTSDRSQGGLGLGLSLVHILVESHGGSVHAKSDGLGKGSAFTIRLPRMNEQLAEENSDAANSKPMQRASTPLRVMIVDDNADAASTLQMLLDTAGYDVSVQLTATSAIEHARYMRPHVCLLDIGLPDLDGTELARRLRMMPETATAMLIAVTGYGQDQDRARSKAAGFDHHFVKPIDTAHVLELMARIS